MSEVKRLEMDHKGLPFVDDNGVYVLYEDYAELKAQRDALAVECAQYKSLAERFAGRADDYKSEHFGYSVFDSSNEFKQHIKTPATDAYLNFVRADAVQELADAWYAIANETSEGVSISDSTRLKYRQRADDAADFAEQLRAGEPS